MASRKRVRLIHTSDTHLGDLAGHPRSAKALEAVVGAVAKQGGDVLLMVGDVFDNDRISDEVLEFFLGQIRLLEVPVVVLPGNHDPWDANSLYNRAPFRRKPANLHIISQNGGEAITLADLTLDLWGRAMAAHTPQFRPLEGMPPKNAERWLVAMAHAHFHVEGDIDVRSSPIYPEDVAGATCDYLALGHWDRHFDASQGNVVAAYSGSPLEPVGRSGEVGVTVVDLDPVAGVKFQRVQVERIE
ncbi:MAG: hypothetical protein BZY88_03400 [SAR202 cluster bacterium Io17-Chloro-G9]|nr:MAG: hypothetical protein BZY88_03400 [SAR202 cluster bacterium Io17-Chloro-G9]